MIFIVIFVTFFVASNAHTSTDTDGLKKFLIYALRSNETTDFDVKKYGRAVCQLFEPIKPHFSEPGRRIMNKNATNICGIWKVGKMKPYGRNYMVPLLTTSWCRQIKKGLFPKFPSPIKTPVILGGRPALYGEFPHMGAIGWKAKNSAVEWVFKCGSTLISEKFLLTAAHCSKLSLKWSLDIVNREPEIVRLGVVNISDDLFHIFGYPVDVEIERFIVHPNYEAPKKYYDIALIELETEVIFMSNVHPACLWSDYDVSDLGTEGILTGWGYTEDGTPSNQLQAAVVDFIDTPECETLLQNYHNRNWHGLEDHQMCAGILTGGIDTCQGDSGGPLQVKIPLRTKEKIYWAVAITSFGMRCGRQDRPGVYTRVSSFIDWIEENVWP